MAGRPAPGPLRPAAALEADLEQPGLGELVEVVGGQLPGGADRGGRLVTPQALLAAGDAPVQGRPHRLGEAGQRVEPRLEVETVMVDALELTPLDLRDVGFEDPNFLW